MFDGLTDSERERWLSQSRTVSLKRGETLAEQGDPAEHLYLVESGLLKLVQLTADGQELIVRLVGPGEPFGGVALMDRASYPVASLAAQSSKVRAWPRDRLRPLLEALPQVRTNIMREISGHMADALTRVREMATARVGQRLAFTLLRLARQCGEPGPEGVLIPYSLTRQDLAELSGTTLFTVSRTLRQWEADGLVQSRNRRLLLRSPQRLTRLAEEGS